ncbi:unnamed protein product [Onchocerca ochengi]|uniref:Helitron_like_N domain-containing protein n=1 Tax=Onchocerca ochengi TaxID=42157 RepID=A0A182ECB0_ONCOC|nr:unnamed protein product [Onchocerca ochengi]
MTSFGAEIVTTQFTPAFKVKGQIYHEAGSLLPLPDGQHKFLQMYFIGDRNGELNARCGIHADIERSVIKLRSEEYIHLRDAVVNDNNPTKVGRLTILPSSYTGSPSHMHERSPMGRHDITVYVFRQKLKSLMDFLVKHELDLCDVGLKCAEIPGTDIDKTLHEVETRKMMHGPCGTLNPYSPCMIDGKYFKRYSRALVSNKVTGDEGYLLYKRRSAEDGDKLATTQMRNGDIEVDKQRTLPVIPRSTSEDKINNCLKCSLCGDTLKLTVNMHVQLQKDRSTGIFLHLLLRIGNGKVPVDLTTGRILLPYRFFNLVTSKEEDATARIANENRLTNHNVAKYQSAKNLEHLCSKKINEQCRKATIMTGPYNGYAISI